jgi:hypothetical protein
MRNPANQQQPRVLGPVAYDKQRGGVAHRTVSAGVVIGILLVKFPAIAISLLLVVAFSGIALWHFCWTGHRRCVWVFLLAYSSLSTAFFCGLVNATRSQCYPYLATALAGKDGISAVLALCSLFDNLGGPLLVAAVTVVSVSSVLRKEER